MATGARGLIDRSWPIPHPSDGMLWLDKKDDVLVEAAAADDSCQTEYSAGLTIEELEHFVDDSVAPAPHLQRLLLHLPHLQSD